MHTHRFDHQHLASNHLIGRTDIIVADDCKRRDAVTRGQIINRIILADGDTSGWRNCLARLDQVMVKEGDVVEAGSQIATVGTSGKVAAPQLHFEIRKSRQPIDPRRLIA